MNKKNTKEGYIPYISSTGMNNGVNNFISNNKNVRSFENVSTIANSGTVGSTFYHNYKFVASDHVTALINDNFNKYHYLFINTLLKVMGKKYHFNREMNDFRLSREKIMLPID
ncbi:restriction endonuclease subunit S, partial [Nosocomiicoccus massiliensis]|uniref:restriction endonuclease subunit S n=1 Tax=Nosocomiicoccus massiliensis TaxID=1232430 RepID=UPI0016529B36